jgi:hypothetical protein
VCEGLREWCVLPKLKNGKGMERRRGNWILEMRRKVPSMAKILIFWRFLRESESIECLECPSHGQKNGPDYAA